VSVGGTGGVLSALTLDPRPAAVGRLRDAEGAPVAGLVVTPELEAAAQVGPGEAPLHYLDLPEATTGTDGSFLLRLEPGVYDFELAPPPRAPLARWSIDGRRVDGDVDLGTISLPPPTDVTLTVATLVAATHELAPVAGVEVRLYAVAQDEGAAHLRADGTSSGDGSLTLQVASAPSP
jgi:hypothetical protein